MRFFVGRGDPTKPITVVYCDTGVEIPIIVQVVRETLQRLKREASRQSVPLRVEIASPRLQDRYFVKVIGRGYPPPTNKFRWCTDRLRINPVKRLLNDASSGPSVVLLGTRRGESAERDRTLERHSSQRHYFFRQESNSNVHNFRTHRRFRACRCMVSLVQSPFPTKRRCEYSRSAIPRRRYRMPYYQRSQGYALWFRAVRLLDLYRSKKGPCSSEHGRRGPSRA